jgi:protein-disulfide isomerase
VSLSTSARSIWAAVLALASLANPAWSQSSVPPAVRGNVGAVLEIVEFSDFQCRFCGRAKPVIDSLFTQYGDEVRLEYRHYPLPAHAYAGRAAQAAVEAQEQNAFWRYHDLLFAHQDRLTDVDLIGYADSLKLDTDRFASALSNRKHVEIVERDIALGLSLAVTGTPTFFVNGYRLVGVPPLWVFETALEVFRAGRVEKRALEPVGEPDG